MITPELIRSITVFAYLLAAVFCGISALRWLNPSRSAWIGMTIILTFLAVSKQWNLLPGWVQSIREIAWLQGWYGLRRGFQVVIIVVALLFLFVWLLAILRNSPWQLWLPITGVVVLLALSIVRAISLHTIDAFLYHELAPQIHPNTLIELLSITTVGVSALLASMYPQRPIPAPMPHLADS